MERVVRHGPAKKVRMKVTAIRQGIPFFAAGYIGLKIILGTNVLLASALRPVGLFYAGMLYYVYRGKIKLSREAALLCSAALVFFTWRGFLDVVVFIFLPSLFNPPVHSVPARQQEAFYHLWMRAAGCSTNLCSRYPPQIAKGSVSRKLTTGIIWPPKSIQIVC